MTQAPISAQSPASVFERLKFETAEAHTEIEGAIPLMNTNLNRALYLQVLQRYFGFYEPLERLLAPFVEQVPAIEFKQLRLKTPHLKNDLQNLGLTDDAMALLPRCSELPQVNSLPEALGVLYVLEGASLGGQIISRHVEKTLQLTAQNSAAFLAGYGDETGTRWKAFKNTAAGHLTLSADQDQAIAAAKATFSSLNHWMRGVSKSL